MWKIKSRQIVLSLLLLCSLGATPSSAYNEYDWQRKDRENFEEWHRGQQRWRQWEAESNQPEQELLLPGILLGSLVLAGVCSAIFLTRKSKRNSNIIDDNNSASANNSKVQIFEAVEKVKSIENTKKVENIENKEIIIEAIKLAIEIQKYAPDIYTKGSNTEVSIYNGISYYFRIEKLYSQNASCTGSKVLISRNDYAINDGRLLKVDVTSDFELIEVYYSDIFEGNIISMRKVLNSYQDKKNKAI